MNKHETNKQVISGRKAYRQPTLRVVGRVAELTLKLGSLTDNGQPGNFA